MVLSTQEAPTAWGQIKPAEFRDKRYFVSFTAGMNQLYHQNRMSFWTRVDRGVRIAVGVLAVIGAIAAFTGPLWLSVTASVLSAVVAVFLNVLPFAEWAKEHADLFRRWTDLREDVDVLGVGESGPVTDLMAIRLRELEGKLHRICAAEPAPNKKLLKACHDAEELSRQ